MTNRTFLTCLALGCCLLMAAGCSQPSKKKSDESNKNKSAQSKTDETGTDKSNPKSSQSGKSGKSGQKFELPELAEVLGTVPEFRLTDQDGHEYGSADLRGQVWVANFIFTSCKSTCPAQTEALHGFQEFLKLQETLNPALDGIRLVSFTVDPNTDTPQVLKRYAESNSADLNTWKFLTGPREEIWDLCKKGFKLAVAENPADTSSPIAHDPRFVIVDRQMRIRGYFDVTDSLGMEKFKKTFGIVLPEFEPPADQSELFSGNGKVTHLASPPDIATSNWMKSRREKQLATRSGIKAFVDFQFQDQRKGSGITFDPQIVDEQRFRLQVNHYDHGNGICLCDVDGDGRTDIYFTAQATGNELWRNLGGGRFENITDRAGVAVKGRVSVTAAFGDIDNDGDDDLFVTTIRGGNLMFENDGKGNFTDITEKAGVGYVGHSSGALFFDYDRDGRLDLFVTNVGKYTEDEIVDVRHDETSSLPENESLNYHPGRKDAFSGHLKPELDEPSILYHNEGGTFRDVTREMNIVDIGWSGDATPIDANGDGWLDLYVLSMQGHDSYYENVEGKKFVNKSREVFPQTPWGAMGVKAFDFDNDLNLDLYLTDMHSDMAERIGPELEKKKSRKTFPDSMLFRIEESDSAQRKAILQQEKSRSIFGNAFFKGDGKGKFVEISDAVGAENYWPWGLSVADLNADGFQDAFVASSMCFPYRYGVNSLLINEQGKKFVDAEFIVGIEPRPDGQMIKPWFVLDADGADRDNLYCRDRSGKVVVWSALGTRSSAIFDLDDDGDLDIITREFNAPPMVLISNLSEKKNINFLKIRLQGTKSNKNGLGARVILKAGDRSFLQVHDGLTGYLSHSVAPLYFGLGENQQVDEIRIDWPNGTNETRKGPFKSNQTLLIVEGKQ